MTPNELRELADRMADHAELHDYIRANDDDQGRWADDLLLAAAYLREQADRQEREAVGYFFFDGETWHKADSRYHEDSDVVPLYLHPAPADRQERGAVAKVERMGTVFGKPGFGCILPLDTTLRPGDLLYAHPAAPVDGPVVEDSGGSPSAGETLELLSDAVPIVRAYAMANPIHHFGDSPQDPNGAHAWLARAALAAVGQKEPKCD